MIGPKGEQRAREYAGWKDGKPLGPTMQRVMSPEVERELRNLLGFRNRPNPVDLYQAIRDELMRLQDKG